MGTFLTRILNDIYAVTVVRTAASALEWLTHSTPALIMVDLDLSDDGGYDRLRTLRAHSRRDDIPIVVLSDTRSSRASVRCLELGAADVLSKPFNPEELRVRLEKLGGNVPTPAVRAT